jgi:hypothetical protein
MKCRLPAAGFTTKNPLREQHPVTNESEKARSAKWSHVAVASVLAIAVSVLLALAVFPAEQPPPPEARPLGNETVQQQSLENVPAEPESIRPSILGQVAPEDILTHGAPFNLLEVHCVDAETGKPVPDIPVSAATRGDNASWRKADEHGIVRMRLHLPQEYRLTVGSGFIRSSGFRGNSCLYWGKATVDLSGDMGRRLAVEFKLTRGLTVTGKALLPNGDPMTDNRAHCSLVYAASPKGFDAPLDANGEFEFRGLLPGLWRFHTNGRIGIYRSSGAMRVEVKKGMPPVVIPSLPWD